MIRHIPRTGLIILCMMFIAGTAAAQNLIKNPGFEDGTAANFDTLWTILNSNEATFTPATEAENVHGGSRSLKVVNPANNLHSEWKVQIASDTFATVVGTTYNVSYWIKAESADDSVRIEAQDPNNHHAYYQGDFTPGTSWVQSTWTFTADTTVYKVAFDLGENAGTYYIDDVSVTPPSATPSYATWDFEGGLGSWVGGTNATVASVDSVAYSGGHSAALMSKSAGNSSFQNDNSGVKPGQLLIFEVWVPQDTTGIAGIQPFYQPGDWGWGSNWYNVSNLKIGAWNRMAVMIPDTITKINRVGVQVAARSGATMTGTYFVDFVTTDTSAVADSNLTDLSIPSGLTAGKLDSVLVTISWDSTAGNNLMGYNIYRGPGTAKSLADLRLFGTVAASDTSFADTTALSPSTKYVYAVSAFDSSGVETWVSDWLPITTSMWTPIEHHQILRPKKFVLNNNYPNPFNPTTQISYVLPQNAKVTLRVYNVLGRLVSTLVNETQSAGSYTVQFSGKGLASGVYFYRLQAGSFSQVKSMMLIK